MASITRRALAGLALGLVAAAPAFAQDTLRVGYLGLVSHAPSFIAQERG